MAASPKITIRKIYVYRSLIDFILLYPLYSILFAQHGLSIFQISLLFIIWAGTDIVTNVPLGVLADKLPRKWLLAVGPLIEVLGFLTWFIWPTFAGFALGFILWGISGAVIDGTFEAYLYDELKAGGVEEQYVRIAGKTQSFALVANFAATALASVAILLGYRFVTFGSIASLLVASLTATLLPNPRKYEKAHEEHYFALLKAGVIEAFRNKVLLEVILLGSVIGMAYGVMDEYVPLFFHQIGYNKTIVSLIVAVTVLMAALGSFVAHHWEHLATRSFMLLLLATGLMLVGSAWLLGAPSIFLLIVFTFIIKMLNTIYDGKVQHSISGERRATITSISFFGIEIFTVIAFLLYGVVSRHGGNVSGFAAIGIIAMLTALIYLVLTPRLLTKRIRQEV